MWWFTINEVHALKTSLIIAYNHYCILVSFNLKRCLIIAYNHYCILVSFNLQHYIMRRLESTLRNWPFLFGNRTYQWQPLDWTRQLETRNCTVRTLQMIQNCGQITSYIKNKISPLREPIRLASLLWAVRLHQFVVLILLSFSICFTTCKMANFGFTI